MLVNVAWYVEHAVLKQATIKLVNIHLRILGVTARKVHELYTIPKVMDKHCLSHLLSSILTTLVGTTALSSL